MIGYKHKETLEGGKSSYMQLQMASQRRDTNPSNNGTNELVANLDHELLDVRVRAVKCLLRKLECGIVSSDSLKDRVDLLDRCRRWLVKVQERQTKEEEGGNQFRLEGSELDGIEHLIQLLCNLAKHKEFRDLLRKHNVDSLLSKFQSYLVGDYYKCQLAALLNSIVVGQYELSYEGSPSEWFDNKTCPLPTSRQLEMFSSVSKPYSYRPYDEDTRSSPGRGRVDIDSSRNTPAPEPSFSKTATIPLGNENGWIGNIKFFVPSVYLSGTDKRVIHSTVDSLSATNDSLVLMTVCFIRDTLVMDYPSEFFIQESSLLLALAQVTVSKWSDRKIPYTAIQTLLRISNFLRFRFTQLNSSDHYEVPTTSIDQQVKANNLYYDYDGSYSSRMTSKSGPSNSTPTDALVENFVQLFKSLARALLYTSYDLHIWSVFDSFAFTLLKCVSIFPVESKSLTMNLQGILMELAHIWERKNDFHTTVGICLVSTSVLSAMKLQNETFIVSKDVRNMLRSISYSPVIRAGWPGIFEHFLQFSSFFDPSAGAASEQQQQDNANGDDSDNHPKKRLLKLLYAVQNASSHEEVFNSVDSLRDILFPIVYNLRLGNDSLSHILQDIPWRDTFYRFLCVEPRTEGDEDLLSRVLDLFTFILQNVINASTFKWITPLCCEKACTTLKLLGNIALKVEMRYGGTAVTDLLRSLLDFYEVILKHGNILATEDTKWELFQIYTAILHSLEQTSYSNFALLTEVTKCLANISESKSIQSKLKENPIMPVALLHRLTDAVMVLEANGSLLEGFKNNAALYYISVGIAHMLIPIVHDENFKNFKNDWIDRCGRTFHILAAFPDSRIKSQAFQLCEILTSTPETKRALIEKSFKNSPTSLMEMAYSAFIEPNHNASIKFRAGKVIWNILNESDMKRRFQLVKILQHGFPVLVNMSRLSSHALWTSRLSLILRNVKSEDKQNDALNGSNEGIPFITPKVLSILCKILMAFLQSLLLEPSELDGTLNDVASSGICQMMFRIVLNHPLKTETDCRVWLDCCCSLSSVLEALIHLSKLDRTIPTILIGEKRCLSTMFSLLELEIPTATNGQLQEKLEVALNAICGNVLTLGTILCCDAGNNFEDLERVAWSQQEVLFKKLTNWLNVTIPVESRKCALLFTHAFLSVLSHRTKPQMPDPEQQPPSVHPFLCRSWKENRTYGQALCEQLINILKHAVDNEERMSSMKSLTALFNLSDSSVQYAVEENDLIYFCVKKLQSFGNKFFETKGSALSGRNKSANLLQMETLCYMQLLSCLFYVSSDAKKAALKNNFPDVLHKIFGWWTSCGDPDLLHAYIEALLNFTEKYPEGALALTLTSNIVGVGPRRVPTQQSIFIEILGILEKELANIESNNLNLKTIEIIFELLKNICFVQECRNILLKSPAVLFLRRIHLQETKKWGNKQNTVKANYLDFLVHASAHPDVQNCIAKIPEGLEILIHLAESDNPPCSILALKVLRNLCFNSANRGRLITENMFMPLLSHKLLLSTDLQEIEHATVSLWALIANYEKGKLTAKKAYCVEGISKALERLRKLEQTTNSEKDVPRLISLLETIQKLFGTTTILTNKLATSSRSSSETQL